MAKQTGHGGTFHGKRTRRQQETESDSILLPIVDVTPATPQHGHVWIKRTGSSYQLQAYTPDGIKSVTLS